MDITFYVLLAGSGFLYVYGDPKLMIKWIFVPVFFILNMAIIGAIFRIRQLITSYTRMFPNEVTVYVHILVFSMTTLCWFTMNIFSIVKNRAFETVQLELSDKAYLAYYNTSTAFYRTQIVYNIMLLVIYPYMLFILHQFSTFEPTRLDPVTH